MSFRCLVGHLVLVLPAVLAFLAVGLAAVQLRDKDRAVPDFSAPEQRAAEARGLSIVTRFSFSLATALPITAVLFAAIDNCVWVCVMVDAGIWTWEWAFALGCWCSTHGAF